MGALTGKTGWGARSAQKPPHAFPFSPPLTLLPENRDPMGKGKPQHVTSASVAVWKRGFCRSLAAFTNGKSKPVHELGRSGSLVRAALTSTKTTTGLNLRCQERDTVIERWLPHLSDAVPGSSPSEDLMTALDFQ